MHTLDQVLENALQLSCEQQEMLINFLQRNHERRCAEIARDAKQTLADFHAGKFQRQSANDVIAALRESLN